VRGTLPYEFMSNPSRWSPEEAYAQMDRFTYEEFAAEELTFATVLIPPLRYEGISLKGLYCAPGVDVIEDLLPKVGDYFISIANSRWASYPQSAHADGYFVLYDNRHREADFRRRTGITDKVFIPRQTADHTNEYLFQPLYGTAKDIDILLVSRIHRMKNLQLLAKAIRVLNQMGGSKKYHLAWACGRDLTKGMTREEQQILRDMQETLDGRLEDSIEMLGAVAQLDMPQMYARSKVLVLTSRIEGKNRAMSEAMCSGTAVVALEDFNLAARGTDTFLPEQAGLTVRPDAESLALGIGVAVNSYGDFQPREAYLRTSGRRNFFWDCLLSFESFSTAVPGTERREREVWLDSAIKNNYGVTLNDFLYFKHSNCTVARASGLQSLSHAQGVHQIQTLFAALIDPL
jgi:glycosyltransferase involved in cell wall biosynthesis